MGKIAKFSREEIAACLPLHPLEARILVVLSQGPAHAYRLVQEIEQRDAAWTTIFPANLYRRIRALSGRGLIAHAADATDASPRGRRSFELTPLGRAVATAEADRLRELLADFDAADLVTRPESR